MSGLHQLLLASVTTGGGGASVTWNPADAAANLVLSSGNLVVTKITNNAYGTVRSTTSKTTGKYYFEVFINEGTDSPFIQIGVANASASLTSGIGNTANGWSYYQETGDKANNNVFTAYGATYTDGDVIGVALNMDDGEITFYKNNSSQGLAFTGLTGALFAAVSLYRQDSPSHQITGRFKSSDFTYSPPGGYSPWE